MTGVLATEKSRKGIVVVKTCGKGEMLNLKQLYSSTSIRQFGF
jgi:hypothetical protein